MHITVYLSLLGIIFTMGTAGAATPTVSRHCNFSGFPGHFAPLADPTVVHINNSAALAKLLHSREKLGRVKVSGLLGRVLRGKRESDFRSLTMDHGRDLILFTGNIGLEKLVGLSNVEILEAIGYERSYIERLTQDGTRFKLVFFENPGPAFPATWQNISLMAARRYPLVAEKLKAQMAALQKTPFAKIQKSAPEPLASIYDRGPSDPNYITLERLAASAGELWKVRAFFYNALRLNGNFSGDGFTYNSDGVRGVPEYIAENREVSSLNQVVVFDLTP